MIFRGFDGRERIVFHTPNKKNKETGVFEHVSVFYLENEDGEPAIGERCVR